MNNYSIIKKGMKIRVSRLCSPKRDNNWLTVKLKEKSAIEGKTGTVERIDESGKIWCDIGFNMHALYADDEFEIIENDPVVAVEYSAEKGWNLIRKSENRTTYDLLHSHLGDAPAACYTYSDLGDRDISMRISDIAMLEHHKPSFVILNSNGSLRDIVYGNVVFIKEPQEDSESEWSDEELEYLRTKFIETETLVSGNNSYPVKVIVSDVSF